VITKFDEAFYRNKRAALASSALLIAAKYFSLSVDSHASTYFFKIGATTSTSIIIVILLAATYLNLSYFLYYATEVPRWRRDSESGIAEVNALRVSLQEMKEQTSNEEIGLLRIRDDTKNSIEALSKSASRIIPSDFPSRVGQTIQRLITGPMGPIYTTAFNQLSQAIHKDGQIEHILKGNINWQELADRVSKGVIEKLNSKFDEAHNLFLETIKKEIEEQLDEVRRNFEQVKLVENNRIEQLKLLNHRFSKSESQLKRWGNAMNIRLRFQYLFFPVALFLSAISYSGWGILHEFMPHIQF
jgi:hypothetical protein